LQIDCNHRAAFKIGSATDLILPSSRVAINFKLHLCSGKNQTGQTAFYAKEHF